ncbi:MAG: hypothetical protein R3Y16_01650 [Rikenellaceae bacterium]
MDVIDFEGNQITKIEALSKASNRVLSELYMRAMGCSKVRDYYDIAVVGYYNDHIVSLLTDSVDEPFISVASLDEMCSKSGSRWINLHALTTFSTRESLGEVSNATMLLEAKGATPMLEAMFYLYEIMDRWCSRPENYESVAPTVLHITDGHPTDSDLGSVVDAATRIMELGTNDGGVLLLNIHLEDRKYSPELLFPTDEEISQHPDRFVQMMARASSIVPKSFYPLVREMKGSLSEQGHRALGCNVSVIDMISMMSIGTLTMTIK